MKNFFNTKSVRERMLMTGFLLIAVVTWGSSLLGRSRLLQVDHSVAAAELAEQLTWLKNKAQVDERTKKITTQLDPSRTFNATQAFAEVQRLAQGLPAPEITTVRPVGKANANFTINSLQVTIRQAGLEPLLKFYKELSSKAPYLGIESCSVSTNRGTPGLITVVLRIYSVEVLNPATKS